MDGFFFILSENGKILFISENIDKFVGYGQIEMMGVSVFNFIHPADQVGPNICLTNINDLTNISV